MTSKIGLAGGRHEEHTNTVFSFTCDNGPPRARDQVSHRLL